MNKGCSIPEDVIQAVTAITGPDGIKRQDRLSALAPGHHPDNLAAGFMILPASTEELAAILRICNAARIGVVAQGGRTGISGAAASRPGEVIVATHRLNRVRRLDPLGATAEVEAGVTLQELDEAAGVHGLCAGIDLGARGSCTIGGMIATNAGGAEAFRFGTMRHRVLGIEAVLADGTILSDLTRILKVNTGYDIKQLLAGSEGTLAIIARAVIKLEPAARVDVTALVSFPDICAAVKLLRQLLRANTVGVSRAELMSGNNLRITAEANGLAALMALGDAPVAVIFECSQVEDDAVNGILSAAIEDGTIRDAVLAKNEAERRAFWITREDWAVDRRYPGGLWFDISIPLDLCDAYVAKLKQSLQTYDPALDLYYVGHLGDGNLHLTVNSDQPLDSWAEEISALAYDGLAECGGAFSAEHGIGLEKRYALRKYGDPGKLKAMRLIKRALDPNLILNPGKVLTIGTSDDE